MGVFAVEVGLDDEGIEVGAVRNHSRSKRLFYRHQVRTRQHCGIRQQD